MHLKAATRASALGASLILSLTACGSGDSSSTSDDAPAAIDYSIVERPADGLTKRANIYESTDELLADSTLVVVATGTGKVRRDEAEDAADPLTVTTAVIDEVISGEGYKVGDEISIFAEGARDEDGQLTQDKIRAKKSYVLYLTAFRKESQGQVFAVTGYLAGMYEAVAPNQYGRVDGESPDLPRGLDLTGAQIREVP